VVQLRAPPYIGDQPRIRRGLRTTGLGGGARPRGHPGIPAPIETYRPYSTTQGLISNRGFAPVRQYTPTSYVVHPTVVDPQSEYGLPIRSRVPHGVCRSETLVISTVACLRNCSSPSTRNQSTLRQALRRWERRTNCQSNPLRIRLQGLINPRP
jgi:hypothetical protein